MELNKKTYLQKHLEQLSIIQLEEMLQTEIQTSEPDGELVRTLLQILEDRDQQNLNKVSIEGGEAWEKYKAEVYENRAEKKKHSRSAIRIVAALAAVFAIIVLALPQMVRADGWLELIAKWSDDFLEIFSSTNDRHEEYVFQTDDPGLRQIYDAVTEMGISEPVVPMWIEDGYELIDIGKTVTPSKSKVHARLSDGENEIVFTITLYTGETLYKIHKSEEDPVKYESNGIEHYISHNDDKLVAVWIRENTVCTLSVDCQEETLYKMLDSIYTTEEN